MSGTLNGRQTSDMDRQQLKDALAWQVAIGADAALLDNPAGDVAPLALSKWLASHKAAPMASKIVPPSQAPAAVAATPEPTSEEMAVVELREAAPVISDNGAQPASNESAPLASPARIDTLAQIDSLEALKAALQNFEGCALKHTASNLVFADGNPDAKIMLIGEAPGRDEDRSGLPFVGSAGQLLDKMLKSIGLDRTSVYICNILPWRPPGNRTPTAEETQILWPFLLRHIQLKAPHIILAMGGSSAKLLLNETTGILKLRGRTVERDFGLGKPIPVLPTLHPAYLLRSPGQKRLSYEDLLTLQSFMNGMK